MAGALETLCGQAYGAGQYYKISNYTCSAIISLLLVCVPVSLIWIFIEKILIFFGQDPLISHMAAKYSISLIPALFGYAVLQSLVRYFQSQSLIYPLLISSCSVLCLHVPICWVLVFKLELGLSGASLAIGISYWLNVLVLGIILICSSDCKETHLRFSFNCFLYIKDFILLAIPSAIMVW